MLFNFAYLCLLYKWNYVTFETCFSSISCIWVLLHAAAVYSPFKIVLFCLKLRTCYGIFIHITITDGHWSFSSVCYHEVLPQKLLCQHMSSDAQNLQDFSRGHIWPVKIWFMYIFDSYLCIKSFQVANEISL